MLESPPLCKPIPPHREAGKLLRCSCPRLLLCLSPPWSWALSQAVQGKPPPPGLAAACKVPRRTRDAEGIALPALTIAFQLPWVGQSLFRGGLAPQEWVRRWVGACIFCKLGAEQCSGCELQQGLPQRSPFVHSHGFGERTAGQRGGDVKPDAWVSCLQPPGSRLLLEAGSAAEVVLQGNLPPSFCPSHPGSPEVAAAAAEGWLFGARR